MDHSRNILRKGNQQNTGDENREGEIKSRRVQEGSGMEIGKEGLQKGQ